MPWVEFNEVKEVLEKYNILPKLRDCPDCAAKPGTIHSKNCDVQRCSACGGQRIQCGCRSHDPAFSRWTGFWPGQLECIALGILAKWDGSEPSPGWGSTPISDLNRFFYTPYKYGGGLHLYPALFFVKPKKIK